MRENQKTGRGEGTPSLGSGVSFPRCHWTEDSVPEWPLTKSPEDLSILRVERVTSGLAASAPFLTATLRAMTSYLPAVMAMVITALVAIVVARGDIHGLVPRHGLINHGWRATHYGRRTRRGHYDWARGMKDWQRQPKREVKRDTCLGGAGQSGNCNHCYQTEQMFCFHGGSDGAVGNIFDSGSLIKTEDY